MRTVLSIGHNKGMNHLISTIVSGEYGVVVSDNVFYGMHLIKNQSDICVVVVDIDMHLKECLEFIRHINSSKVYKKPCIVLSAKQTKSEVADSLDTLVHDYFVKPFDPLEISKSIGRIEPVNNAKSTTASAATKYKK